jgi:putative membrane protein
VKRDHEAVNKKALDPLKKLDVKPEDNDTSRTLSVMKQLGFPD